MASNNGWGPFLSYWVSYCKDAIMTLSTSGQDIKFSEGLLTALCYETDVGCIPRGMKLDTAGDKPIYFHSNNWNKQIEGCYWCRDDYHDLNGICCSKECFFYLHDWCVERVHSFTNRRFCRLPGCDTNTVNNNLYCDTKHKANFDSEFPKGSDHQALLKTVIREGPTWYCPNENIPTPPHVTPQQKSNSTSQNTKQPPKQKSQVHGKNKTNDTSTILSPIMDFPTDLHNAMIFKTDIGIIPRIHPNEHHLTSPYSSSDNWLREIEGCYWCGNKSNVNFCRYRCYLVFYEWCRMKVHSFTGINMCRNTGCNRTAAEGFDCCNREHSLAIEDKYSKVKKIDSERLTAIGPNWYKKCDVQTVNSKVYTQNLNTNQSQNPVSTPTAPQQSTAPNQYSTPPVLQCCVFSWELTQFLYHCTDVGPIPREIIQFLPIMDNVPSPNWKADIKNICYWCCTNQLHMKIITCSDRCLYLLNEWVHSLYTSISKKVLCRVMGCELPSAYGFDCCNRTHSKEYERFNHFSHLLKSTEFALGPRWYNDYSQTPINFYNRNEPFYELTNFYPCNNLVIDEIRWPTTEHYFQASKFAGTPYVRFISQLQAPRDAFDFSRNPGVQCWVRTNWPTIKIAVMLKALRCKFIQNADLAQKLIRTGEKRIFEHTKNDKFWGDGGDWKGLNKLGELLMVVRTELRFQYSQESQQPIVNTFQQIQMKDFIPMNSVPTYFSNPQISSSQSNTNENNVQTSHSSLLSPMNQTPVTQTTQGDTTNSCPCTEDLINLGETVDNHHANGHNASTVSTNTAPHTPSQGDSLTQIPAPVIQPTHATGQNVTCNTGATHAPLFEPGIAKHELKPDYDDPFRVSESPQHSPSLPNTFVLESFTHISKEDFHNPFLPHVISEIDMTEANMDKFNPFIIERNSLTQQDCSRQTEANRPSIPKAVGDVGVSTGNQTDLSIKYTTEINFRLSEVKKPNFDLSPGSTPLPDCDDEDLMDTDNN